MTKQKSKHLTKEGNIFLRPLFKKLNEENIRYCVLRNFETLPESTGGSDVDMWVHSEDLARIEELLKEVSVITKMPLVSFYDAPTQYKVCYMGIEDGVQFDIFKGDIYWRNHIMFSGKSIEANIIMYNGVKVLNEEFADVMAVIKELIYTKSCKQKYIDKIYQTNIYSESYLKKFLDLFSSDFLAFFADCLTKHTINENLKKLSKMSQRHLKKENSLSKLRYILSKFKRLFKKPGFVICVEGTDGSGKSFIIDSITPMLNGAFHNHVTYKHFRPNLLPDIGVLLGKRIKDTNQTVESNPHANNPSGFLMSIIRVCYYMLDFTFGYFKSIFPLKCTRTHVFIFDRYYYDYYIDQRRAHVNLPRWILKCFEVFVPSPDITLCLGGEPAKIYSRKPETSLEEVTRQTNILKIFCNNKINAFWIDTTLKQEESIMHAMSVIIDVMSKRFKGTVYTSKIK